MTLDPTLHDFDGLAAEVTQLTTDLGNARDARDKLITAYGEACAVIRADQARADALRVWQDYPQLTVAQEKLDAAIVKHRVMLQTWVREHGR